MENLVSTEKKELKHDLEGGRHSTTTSHGRSKFRFLVLQIPKPYMKLAKYTKLNKLVATEDKVKAVLHFKRDIRSSRDQLPQTSCLHKRLGRKSPSSLSPGLLLPRAPHGLPPHPLCTRLEGLQGTALEP